LPGMYVRAVIEQGFREGTILIPQKAVMRDVKNQPMVYVLVKENPHPPKPVEASEKDAAKPAEAPPLEENDYYVAMRYITLDRDYNNSWLVTDGLKPGDRVMVDGLQKVRPGQVVTGELIKPESVTGEIPAADTQSDASPKVSQSAPDQKAAKEKAE